jgi:hypothetical protein
MNKIKFKCDYCGKEIERQLSSYNLYNKHYCCGFCRGEAQKKRTNYLCTYCGKSFSLPLNKLKTKKYHFCQKTCYIKWLSENSIAHKNPSWKGGRVKTNEGYIRIYMPNHPESNKQYVLEHRLIMEQKLGRYLTKDELVHHLNGIKDDNRPENLVVTFKPAHEKKTIEKVQARRIQELEYQLSHIYGCPN